MKVNVKQLVHNHLVARFGNTVTAKQVLVELANRNDNSTTDFASDVATELSRTNGTYIRASTVERRIREFKQYITN